jgi:hypothetical protein
MVDRETQRMIRLLHLQGYSTSEIVAKTLVDRRSVAKYAQVPMNGWEGSEGALPNRYERAELECVDGNHAWMKEDAFAGVGFSESRISEPSASGATLMLGYVRTCMKCKRQYGGVYRHPTDRFVA